MERDFVLQLINGARSKRSRQRAVGPSEIGGCRRRVWHRLQGTPPTNPETLGMAAWMGTAIHAAIEKRIQRHDPFQQRFLLEVEVEHGGLKGHVDCYDIENREVIDWKTTTKRGLSDFPSEQQVWQVQVYGWLLTANGREVQDVTLIGIPRDGNETHIKIYTEPYDPAKAQEAIAWLTDVQGRTEPPNPEKPARFCRDYCQFYDATGEHGCPSSGGR